MLETHRQEPHLGHYLKITVWSLQSYKFLLCREDLGSLY